ncbi:MAG: tetratricopeptide repeat protein [Deltaproteobacteria bacterium]|nr:tetratricopeptide repeat protein [Deltaproteobacteria bacterium]MBW2257672.1 tetratricopeptide repeat protein [Deltaproteobacteria bacterium]
MRFLLALVALFLLGGCQATHAYREGRSLEEGGRLPAAAESYLDALDARASHGRARAALEALALPAYEARLGAALRAERQGDFRAALERYRRLEWYLERLERHGELSFQPGIDVAEKIVQAQESAAGREYFLAEKSLGAGRWEEAIEHFQAALEVKEGYRDAEARIAGAWFAWADEDVGAGRYRDAAEGFRRALDLGYADAQTAATRAAEIFAALGRYHLDQGACRQAVRDLSAARRLLPEALEEDLAAAEACAEVRVVVAGLAAPARSEVAGIDVRTRLSAGVLALLPAATSPFVVLVDESALRTPAAGPGPVGHYLVASNLVAATLHSPWPVERERVTSGETWGRCVEEDDEGTHEEPCRLVIDVQYTEVSEEKEVGLSASVRLVALPGRTVVDAHTFEVTMRDATRYAHDFQDAETGRPVDPADDIRFGVAVENDVLALENAHDTLAPDLQLATAAIDQLTDEMVEWIAVRVDVEDEWSDPEELPVLSLE